MADIPQSLLGAIRDGSLVPFVGSGLSLTVGRGVFPSWGGLIERLAARLEREALAAEAAAVRGRLGVSDYAGAAELAVASLTESRFYEEMRAAFDVRRPLDTDLTAVEALWRLRAQLLITTNYEAVLEWPFDRPVIQPYPPPAEARPDRIYNDDPAALSAVARMTPFAAPRVWHLHGSVKREHTIVLTQAQYDALYRPDERGARYEQARTVLRNLLATRPLLFVGFSLKDPVFYEQVRAVIGLTQGTSPVSYLFVVQGERGAAERLALLAKDHVQVVEFADFGAPMVRRLNEIAAAAFPPADPLADRRLPPATAPLVRELRALLADVVLPPAAVAAAYNDSRPEGWSPFPLSGDGVALLERAVLLLADAPRQRDTDSFPLVALATRLRAHAPELAARLDAWIDAAAAALARDAADAARIKAGAAAPRPPAASPAAAPPNAAPAPPLVPYVLVRVLEPPGGDAWSAQAWVFADDVPEKLFPDERRYARGDSAALVSELLLELEARAVDAERAVVAFLVPRRILCEPVDEWRPVEELAPEPAIGTRYAVTVRSLERATRAPRALERARHAWARLKAAAGPWTAPVDLAALGGAPDAWAVWLTPEDAGDRELLGKLQQGRVACAVLAAPPPASPASAAGDLFNVVLQAGIPVVVWVRDAAGAPAGLRAEVERLVGEAAALELPRRLLDHRKGAARGMTLLFDVPDYLPPDQDPDNRAALARA